MKDFELSLPLCHKMAEEADKIQKEMGVWVSIALADRYGNLLYFYRFGDAIIPSVDIAQKKAYTSAVLRQTTKEFGKLAQPGGEAFGINTTHQKLVIFGGGVPIIINGKTLGGIGVSGASAEEDEVIAKRMLEILLSTIG